MSEDDLDVASPQTEPHPSRAATKKERHTPGPWVGFNDGAHTIALMPAGRDGEICIFARSPSDADAHLMAAAPDLIAVVKAFKNDIGRVRLGGGHHERYEKIKKQARAAIRKAEGRT